MDIGEGGAMPVILADWLDRILTIWHDHRIVVTALILFGLLVVLVRRSQTPRVTPRGSSPAIEKANWLPEPEIKIVPSLTSSGTDDAQQVGKVQQPNLSQKGKPRSAARVVTGRKPAAGGAGKAVPSQSEPLSIQPLIFFSSLTGTAERLSKGVADRLDKLSKQNQVVLKPEIHDLSYIDLDDYFISGPKSPALLPGTRFFYLLLIPSYDIDTILNTFLAHLDETHNDFRIDASSLSVLAGYSVFGIGDREGWPTEEKGFCSQALEVDRWMAKLTGRKRAYPLGLGDVKSNVNQAVEDWASGITSVMEDLISTGSLGEGVPGSGDAIESEDEEEDETFEDDPEVDFPDSGRNKRRKLAKATDLEDVGGTGGLPLAVDFTTYSSPKQTGTVPLKAMVPKESPTYAALTKQGYTIVGSHSGVKNLPVDEICASWAWLVLQKLILWNRLPPVHGNHPSLSCSNKCVFCWRHGTNPVSTTWRWEVDDPQMIFDGAKEGHYKKIKMMRGVPGVRSDRFEEAMRIRHCALSLVGEPIFYPRINEFVGLLHSEHISSFLVCNAQHPQQLRELQRVTQLYVSIDASNRDSLRKIDRPLHRDFWERFQTCLDILREKRFVQRTVFRLTLVKGFNVEDEVEGYADLVAKGLPCFIEIKGATFTGPASSLTMQNIPFYEEVVTFVEALDQALAKRGLDYGIGAEHAHSCCVLLASKRFYINGKWNTIIDYKRFFKLLDSGADFGPEDYCSETPEWAAWGNGGFDPRDERVDRKGRPKNKAAEETAKIKDDAKQGEEIQF